MSGLHATTIGDGPIHLVLLHGLLGQGKNLSGVARAVSDIATCYLIDAPNHGLSDWINDFNYRSMAQSIADELLEIQTSLIKESPQHPQKFVVLGHSMGGKIAMCLALDHPELVSRLCVADISPVTYPASDYFVNLIHAMQSIDLSTLSSRRQADELLASGIPEPAIRGFVLQNLHRETGSASTQGWHWRANLDVLARSVPIMESFPDYYGKHWDGPVLWISGGTSDYIKPVYYDAMTSLFPHTNLATIPDAGHWVHADQPEIVAKLVRDFMTQ